VLETPAVVASVGHALSMAVICAGTSPALFTMASISPRMPAPPLSVSAVLVLV
jgi:hypothetical protein